MRGVKCGAVGRLLLAAADLDLRLWTPPHVESAPSSILIAGETEYISCAMFSPDGLYVASGSKNGSIRIWSAGSNRAAVQPLVAHDIPITLVTITPDASVLVLGSNNGSIHVWDTQTGELRFSFPSVHTDCSLESVAISGGHLIASALSDGTVSLWDMQTGGAVGRLQLIDYEDEDEAIAMVFSLDTQLLAVRTSEQLYIWNLKNGERLSHNLLPCYSGSLAVAFSPDGNFLATSGGTYIQVWDTKNRSLLHTLQTDNSISSVAFSCNTRLVSADGRVVRVWDIATGEQTSVVMEAVDVEGQVNISADGQLAVTMLGDDILQVLDAVTGAQVATLQGHIRFPIQLAFQLGTRHAVSYLARDSPSIGGKDKRICIWNITAARSRSSGVDEDPTAALVSSTLRDGWLTGPSGELLLWVPEEYREHLQVPPCTMLIDWCRVVITPGDSGWHRGESWTSCWRVDAFDVLLRTR